MREPRSGAAIEDVRLVGEGVHAVELRERMAHTLNRVGKAVHEVTRIHEQGHERNRHQRSVQRHHVQQHELHGTGEDNARQDDRQPHREAVAVNHHAQADTHEEQACHDHAGGAHRLGKTAHARLLGVRRVFGCLDHGNNAGQRKGGGDHLNHLLRACLVGFLPLLARLLLHATVGRGAVDRLDDGGGGIRRVTLRILR